MRKSQRAHNPGNFSRRCAVYGDRNTVWLDAGPTDKLWGGGLHIEKRRAIARVVNQALTDRTFEERCVAIPHRDAALNELLPDLAMIFRTSEINAHVEFVDNGVIIKYARFVSVDQDEDGDDDFPGGGPGTPPGETMRGKSCAIILLCRAFVFVKGLRQDRGFPATLSYGFNERINALDIGDNLDATKFYPEIRGEAKENHLLKAHLLEMRLDAVVKHLVDCGERVMCSGNIDARIVLEPPNRYNLCAEGYLSSPRRRTNPSEKGRFYYEKSLSVFAAGGSGFTSTAPQRRTSQSERFGAALLPTACRPWTEAAMDHDFGGC